MLRLTDLIPGERLAADPEITGLSADSRKIAPGMLFAALPGTKADGGAFIREAVARGAAAVLAPAAPGDIGVPVITDSNPRRRLALIAARYFGRQPETVVAVTGTNGKSSTVHFCRQLWTALGMKAASLGTLGLEGPGLPHLEALTTPDPVSLHQNLSLAAGAGVSCLAMEASSHGLAQFRLDGVKLAAAGFSNLSRDHLDYHAGMEEYFSAKARLFSELLQKDGAAVLNADVPEFEPLSQICASRGVRLFSYGRDGNALVIEKIEAEPTGLSLRLDAMAHRARLHLNLVGGFQAWNALCALGLVMAGLPPSRYAEAIDALETLTPVRGRLQLAATAANGAAAYVDYAHSPDALETVLTALRPHCREKLIVVFGCGGDRDTGKRPVMGGIAARLANVAIVTDDNPRTEDPAAIRAAVLAGCPGGREIGDRAEAIRAAFAMAGPRDLILIAGKGHERGQIRGGETLPFDDTEEAAKAAREAA
jgi:UDP-N-acetylmuramoyl-L-alanyl-D-glutamate--2,6-diaminopimelate ligase